MRLWILVLSMVWGLIACSQREITPQPSPTGSPVELTVDDIEIELVTATGWQTYSTQDRITMSYEDSDFDDIIVNIWIPETNLADYVDVVDAAFHIADVMETDQEVNIAQPTAISWNGYDAAYFLVGNAEPRTSMIIVVQITETDIIALNVRGIIANFEQVRTRLADTFETLTVNGSQLGNDVFIQLPSSLILPSNNPEAAFESSAEP